MDKEYVMILKVLGAKTSKTEKNALLHAIYCIKQRKGAKTFFCTKLPVANFLQIFYNSKGHL